MKTYCPTCENELIHVENSLLWSEYYYCQNCDDILVPKLYELKNTGIKNRLKGMKRLAKIRNIKNNLKIRELEELGYEF